MTNKAFDRVIHAVQHQTNDLCIEVRKDANIVIIHLDNGEREAVKLPPDQFRKIYELLTVNGTPIQKPDAIE